jgi:hypothetical protein
MLGSVLGVLALAHTTPEISATAATATPPSVPVGLSVIYEKPTAIPVVFKAEAEAKAAAVCSVSGGCSRRAARSGEQRKPLRRVGRVLRLRRRR